MITLTFTGSTYQEVGEKVTSYATAAGWAATVPNVVIKDAESPAPIEKPKKAKAAKAEPVDAEPVDAVIEEPAAPAKEYTVEEARAALIDLVKSKGPSAAEAILKKFGVAKVSEVPAERREAMIQDAKAAVVA